MPLLTRPHNSPSSVMYHEIRRGTGHGCAADETDWTLRKLNDLGSPYAIAGYLKTEGIRGMRHSAKDCPVAKLIHRNVTHACPGAFAVAVGSYTTTIHLSDKTMMMVTPQAVSEFIRLFDRDEFPDLAENPLRRPGDVVS